MVLVPEGNEITVWLSFGVAALTDDESKDMADDKIKAMARNMLSVFFKFFMRPPYFINDVLFFKYLYSRNICKKQKLFLCLEVLQCGVWTVNSGFVFGGLVPCPYGHIPGAFLYVCKGYSSGVSGTFQIFLTFTSPFYYNIFMVNIPYSQ